jgi:hypothetical protein
MQKDIINNPIKEIQIDITFNPRKDSGKYKLYVEDSRGVSDHINIERAKGKKDPNVDDKYSFNIYDKDIQRIDPTRITLISIDAVDLPQNKNGSFIVGSIAIK